jgi:hypothetical protein
MPGQALAASFAQDRPHFCFSMDTDWCTAETIRYVFDHIVDSRLALTMFCTDNYPVLSERPRTEIALHYNMENGGFEQSFKYIAEQFPEARGSRGHSLAFSERLRPVFRERRIAYDSSYLMYCLPHIRPFLIGRGLWEYPIYFMDMFHMEMAMNNGPEAPAKGELALSGLKVLDFHPVHLLLNTPTFEFYFQHKHFYHDTEGLLRHAYPGFGVRSLFEQYQKWVLEEGWQQSTLLELTARIDPALIATAKAA